MAGLTHLMAEGQIACFKKLLVDSGLNYFLSESPFSVKVQLRKSFIRVHGQPDAEPRPGSGLTVRQTVDTVEQVAYAGHQTATQHLRHCEGKLLEAKARIHVLEIAELNAVKRAQSNESRLGEAVARIHWKSGCPRQVQSYRGRQSSWRRKK